MTEACLFLGPTLAVEAAKAVLPVRCLPPVAQGDVVRVVREARPRAIGIVDGFFGGAPSVWHKEILWAMAEGVAVFGAASMGALRAAELHGFGMRGVGRIFEAYRDGALEDDDEVAVVHAPAEMGYAALSEPMVSLRATLVKAEEEAVLSPVSRRSLEARAKALHFPDRSWPALLEGAASCGVGMAESARLAAWLPTGRIDLKRDDALAMLEAMRGFLEGQQPDTTPPTLEMTHFLAAALAAAPSIAWPDHAIAALVLDEFRLGSRALVDEVTGKAVLRLASGREWSGVGEDRAGEDAVARKLDTMRASLGLFSGSSLAAWLAANDLQSSDVPRLVAGTVRVDRFTEAAKPSLAPHLLDELRLAGAYPGLAERARRKQARLATEGAGASGLPSRPERIAMRLSFAGHLGLPQDAGIETILAASGFADASTLDRVLHRERLYLTLIAPDLDR